MATYTTVMAKKMSLDKDHLSTKASFEAILSSAAPLELMYKLTIKLRICFQPLYTTPPRVGDANGNPFWIRPWTPSEWQTFVNGARAQANLWNNRFWLKPPPGFRDYDIAHDFSGNYAKSVFRPYIACELEVDFTANEADADRT